MPEPDYDISEWKTRKTRIDGQIEDAGWRVIGEGQPRPLTPHAASELPTDTGPADYALHADGRVLGVVEAKRLSIGPQNALVQAERYSKGMPDSPFNFNGYRVPFLYATNGEVIWFHDVRDRLNRSRQISGFHTPSALEEMLGRDFDAECQWLRDNADKHAARIRDYQKEACLSIEAAIGERKRQMLVAMATGTGKTFMAVNQIYRLMKSGVARRVLFLVDRRALAAQAVRAFSSFEPEPGLKFNNIYEVYSNRFQREDFGDDEKFDPKVLPNDYLTDPKPKHAFAYVCTIQRMAINLFGRGAVFAQGDEPIDDDADTINIPIHAFDVIIADECHRGYTTAEMSVWRNTLEHFDAIKIGLTATPAAHTKAYFKDIVYRYTYEQAVRDGFLVDYDAVKIKSDVRMNGVFLKEGEQVGLIDTRTGGEQLDLLEDERQFDTTEVERKVTAPDSNRKIVEEIKKYTDEHEQRYGRFPKTLFFAVNDLPHTSHADQLVTICRDVFGQGESFVRKITGREDRPLQRIREFRNRPNPAIVVSVDMLTTGVDIPDLEFIVFLRPVKSRILWEQMLGRGTRLGDKCRDKSHFTVFDCFDGTLLEYFKNASAFTVDPPDRPSRTISEVIEDIWSNRDRAYNTRCLIKRLQRIDKEMSGEAREMFAAHIQDGDVSRYAKELPQRLQDDFTDTMKLLRDPAFQDLLVNYPRPKRGFVVAYGTEDEVSSEWLIRDGTGNEYKPEDYLEAFGKFVTDNPAHIDAIEILLDRPQHWSYDALSELRSKLSSTKERFTIPLLQKAHEAHYKKSLVDVISMVKHAVDEQKPLLTAEERVDRAMQQVTAGRRFTDEQQQWIDRIREHLIKNLSIGQDDFDIAPILSRSGGWGRANKEFDGDLAELITLLNRSVAA